MNVLQITWMMKNLFLDANFFEQYTMKNEQHAISQGQQSIII
jgi:hypothetical protein